MTAAGHGGVSGIKEAVVTIATIEEIVKLFLGVGAQAHAEAELLTTLQEVAIVDEVTVIKGKASLWCRFVHPNLGLYHNGWPRGIKYQTPRRILEGQGTAAPVSCGGACDTGEGMIPWRILLGKAARNRGIGVVGNLWGV
uniref:Uncharacterized protein n=1 Tax=Oryza meridionalis TaxID=40149 RepID=A0A0E0C2T7_9ORYZ